MFEHNFRPVHYSRSLVPFSTAALRKNFFEQQRELARLHGITIGTSHGVIDNLLAELSNSLLPQCFMNMVASEGTHSNLILKKSNIPIPSEDLIFDNKWGRMVEECHHELLNNQKCFDIPDTALWDIPIPVFREVLKNQFTKNAHITDARIVDRKVDECKQHMVAMK
uniref:Exonuclease domain-containing protein n=1 Tax=Globodera pallida TaxID=36090 RepID=A0A183CGL8_GLOPA